MVDQRNGLRQYHSLSNHAQSSGEPGSGVVSMDNGQRGAWRR